MRALSLTALAVASLTGCVEDVGPGSSRAGRSALVGRAEVAAARAAIALHRAEVAAILADRDEGRSAGPPWLVTFPEGSQTPLSAPVGTAGLPMSAVAIRDIAEIAPPAAEWAVWGAAAAALLALAWEARRRVTAGRAAEDAAAGVLRTARQLRSPLLPGGVGDNDSQVFCDAAQAIQSACREAAPRLRRGPSVETVAAGRLDPVAMDVERLGQAVLNLLLDAVHAAGADGRVTVRPTHGGGEVFIRLSVQAAGAVTAPEGLGVPACQRIVGAVGGVARRTVDAAGRPCWELRAPCVEERRTTSLRAA